MERADPRDQELQALRERLARLSEASLRINENLDFNTVLKGVLDSARSLTGARYGVMILLDASGRPREFLSSGMTAEESRKVWDLPDGMRYFEFLGSMTAPLRLGDLLGHFRSLGLPEFRLPMPMSTLPFLGSPIFHRDERIGLICLGAKEAGEEFTGDDEETLVLFASQAALVIANSRSYRKELRARTDLQTLIDTSPVGVIVWNVRTGTPVSFNREARRIVDGLRNPDQSPEELLQVLTFRRGDGREVSLKQVSVAQALSDCETVRVEEIVMRVPDGRSVTVLLNATPIRSEENGEVESAVMTLQDMTPLQDLERLQVEFLSMVSHDLRVPITSIRGSATALLDAFSDLEPVVMKQFIQIIIEQSDSMLELIGDLLDMARIKAGTLQVTPEPAEIASVVDRARTTFLSARRRNHLHIDLAPDLPLVMADRRRIVQVIGNLLSNAARHSTESSPIRITAVREDAQIAVAVVDEGRGISAERLPHLFAGFSRTDDEDGARQIGGSGLAICKGIVEAHGGRIRAESEGPGRGAQFTFTIPSVEESASGEPPGPPRARGQEAKEGKGGPRPILVVDDDPQTLTYVRKVLSEVGFKPIVTADPEQVPVLMHEHRPHLVLLDLVLPGTDGIELMRDLLGMADVPVVFLSAYGSDQVISRALEMGATDYLVKPFSPTELVARVRAALRQGAALTWPAEPYVLGELTVDYTERRVTLAGRTIKLTAAEYSLLFELSINAGKVISHDRLLRRVLGPKPSSDVRSLRTLVRRLRGKLSDDADDPTYLFAERGVGYRMPKGA